MIPILILAAGRSSRMAPRDKLLEQLDGESLLSRTVRRACLVAPTFVTLPSNRHPRAACLPREATSVPAPGAGRDGLSASLQSGLKALPKDCPAVMVLPADMPALTTEDIRNVYDRATVTTAPIVRATTATGVPGHPVVFKRILFPDIMTLRGDRGAAALCSAQSSQTEFVQLPGQRARLDLDTPEAWKAYRESLKN